MQVARGNKPALGGSTAPTGGPAGRSARSHRSRGAHGGARRVGAILVSRCLASWETTFDSCVAFFLELRSSSHSKFSTYLPNLPTYLQYYPACDRTTYLPTCIPSAPDLPSRPTYLPPVGRLLSEAHARAALTRARHPTPHPIPAGKKPARSQPVHRRSERYARLRHGGRGFRSWWGFRGRHLHRWRRAGCERRGGLGGRHGLGSGRGDGRRGGGRRLGWRRGGGRWRHRGVDCLRGVLHHHHLLLLLGLVILWRKIAHIFINFVKSVGGGGAVLLLTVVRFHGHRRRRRSSPTRGRGARRVFWRLTYTTRDTR